MKWFKRFLVAVMLLASLAITTVYLTPLDVYVPEIEQTLSANFGEPVKISHLKLGLLPFPHMMLERVQVGNKPDAAVQSVAIFFDLQSLLKPQRVIHRFVLEHGTVEQEELLKIMASLHRGKVAANLLRLEELQFNDIRVAMPGLMVGPLEGKLEMAADGNLKQGWISTSDQKMAALIHPQPGGAFQIDTGLRDWSPPGYPAVVIDRMSVSGILSEGRFNTSKFSAEMFGAQVSGMAHLEWQPEWKLDVKLDQFEGELGRLLPLLGYRVEATGMLHGNGHFTAHGSSVHELPRGLTFDADVNIKNAAVRLPLNAQRMLLLDSVRTHVAGSAQRFMLDNLAGELYGGAMHGSAVLQPAIGQLDSDVEFRNISVQSLVAAVSDEVMLTGTLNGGAKLSARLKEFELFPGNVRLNCSFQLKKGVLGKVDLVQAASNPLKSGSKGGKTSFDELSGLLLVDGNGYHLTKLKVSSGAVNATGRLDVSPQLQLKGLLDTDLKGTATLVSMPLAVSGTMSDPVLLPTGSALAGAAVGTALLGPGLGTALGIKIGNLLNKIFGAKSDKDQSAQQQNQTAQPDSTGRQNK